MKTIDFLKYKYLAFGLSWAFIILMLVGTFFRGGFNYGIDFVGGHKIVAKFQESSVDEHAIRLALKDFNPTVQRVGEKFQNIFIITTLLESDQGNIKGADETAGATKYELMKSTLKEKFNNVAFESEETVGPAIGDYLRKSAWKIISLAIIMMSVYLAFRFEVKYSFGAMVALLHDIVMSVAFCGAMGIEINVQTLAALLTLYGYSTNDTIVIFDRIREDNQIKAKETFTEVINKAITQTLSRTLITSMLTFFTVVVLFFMGGQALHDFALVMIFGVIVGTYSSIYIASPSVLFWEKWRAK